MERPPANRPAGTRQRPGRIGWIAAGLAAVSAAAAALILMRPIARQPQPGVTAGITPIRSSPTRSAAELSDALQGSAAPRPKAAPRSSAPGTTPGPIAWDTLTRRCAEDVGRQNPGPALRLVDSVGFVPRGAEAATRLGFAWDQAVRLSFEPAGGGAAVRIECYFQKGELAGKSRG